MDPLHVIHSRAGRIGGRSHTQPGDVDAIVQALRQDSRRHLVIHFHGGLVPADAGFAIAERLEKVFSPLPSAGAYPVFFVWESGAWETIRNNLTELADEPVFRELLRKILQYALSALVVASSPGSVAQATAQPTEVLLLRRGTSSIDFGQTREKRQFRFARWTSRPGR